MGLKPKQLSSGVLEYENVNYLGCFSDSKIIEELLITEQLHFLLFVTLDTFGELTLKYDCLTWFK